MRLVRVLMGRLRMLFRGVRVFLALRVVTLAVMFRGGTVGFCRVFVVLGRLVVETDRRALGQPASEGFDRSLGTWFTSCVRESTNACLERIRAMWAWDCSPLCLTGYKSFGSRRASLARFSASTSSVLRLFE